MAAGFEVVGVDLRPQPEYPGETITADVLEVDPAWLAGFDLVWASPPCQFASTTRNLYDPGHERDLPDLIAPTRQLLEAAGVPYVIENVPRAGQRPDVTLCGLMFGLPIARHRDFELGRWGALQPAHHERCRGRDDLVTVAGRGHAHGQPIDVETARAAIGAGHLRTRWAIDQAVPPAYAAWLASQFVASQVLAEASLIDGQASPSSRDASLVDVQPSRGQRVPSPGADVGSPAGGVGSPLEGVGSSSWWASSFRRRLASPDVAMASCACGAPLLPPGPGGGRPSLHCSKRCRQAAWRARSASVAT